MDIDLSLNASYAFYPMGSQDDEFVFDFSEEGIDGNLSMEFEITPFIKASIVENLSYQTDYVDIRGVTDRYGGQQYRNLQNDISFNVN